MRKLVKKGAKSTTKKTTAKKTTEGRKAIVVSKKTTKKGTTITRKATKGYAKALSNTPEFFKAGRTMSELARDYEKKGKVAKKSKNGKYYVEYKGKDGKKHREYRPSRMDYKFGI